MQPKPSIHIIPHWIARFYFWLTGWQVAGDAPPIPKFVVLAAPHTSNYDGVMLVGASWIVRRKLEFMIKAEWTRGIVGPLIRALGGLGIDRSASRNVVGHCIEKFKERDELILVVPPEGTRKKTDHWKTGFYWIAVGAGVPILLARLDYAKKSVDLTAPLFYPTGDIEADMEKIWDYYRGATARFPEKVSDFAMRRSGLRMPREMRNGEIEDPTLAS